MKKLAILALMFCLPLYIGCAPAETTNEPAGDTTTETDTGADAGADDTMTDDTTTEDAGADDTGAEETTE